MGFPLFVSVSQLRSAFLQSVERSAAELVAEPGSAGSGSAAVFIFGSEVSRGFGRVPPVGGLRTGCVCLQHFVRQLGDHPYHP